MIPIGDVNPRRHLPLMTIALIALNLLVFLYQQALHEPEWQRFILLAGVVPQRLTTAPDWPALRSLITAMFLHGGWLHLLSNMLYLWIFGDDIEERMGGAAYLAFYLVAGVIASLAHVGIYPDSSLPMIGASGAVSGVLGAYLVLYPRVRVRTLILMFRFIRLIELPAMVVLAVWFAMQLLNSLSALAAGTPGGVAWFAHIGGFLAGVLVGLALKRQRRPPLTWG